MSETIIDADALIPIPSRPITINGVTYQSFRAGQVPSETVIAYERMTEHVKGKTATEIVEFLVSTILEFVPELTRDALLKPPSRKGPGIEHLTQIVGLLMMTKRSADDDPQTGQSN